MLTWPRVGRQGVKQPAYHGLLDESAGHIGPDYILCCNNATLWHLCRDLSQICHTSCRELSHDKYTTCMHKYQFKKESYLAYTLYTRCACPVLGGEGFNSVRDFLCVKRSNETR